MPSGRRHRLQRHMTMDDLKTKIRHVPDFPKAGILFYDITTLLQDPAGFRAAIDGLSLPFEDQGIDIVVGIESRGFIFGAAVADRIGAGFSPVRKPGKLPSTCVRADLRARVRHRLARDSRGRGEAGAARPDRRRPARDRRHGARDDRSRQGLGGEVHALAFLIELVALNGRAKLAGENIHAVLQY